jgi:hypothetical protein
MLLTWVQTNGWRKPKRKSKSRPTNISSTEFLKSYTFQWRRVNNDDEQFLYLFPTHLLSLISSYNLPICIGWLFLTTEFWWCSYLYNSFSTMWFWNIFSQSEICLIKTLLILSLDLEVLNYDEVHFIFSFIDYYFVLNLRKHFLQGFSFMFYFRMSLI